MDPRVLADRPLQEGDWLQHEALKSATSSPKAMWWERICKRAEVAHVSDAYVGLWFEGDSGVTTVKQAQVVRWWNPYIPEELITEGALSTFVRGAEFSSVEGGIEYTAVLCTVRLGWVSYIERSKDFTEVFRIRPLDEFRAAWSLFQRSNVWSRLKTPWDSDDARERA